MMMCLLSRKHRVWHFTPGTQRVGKEQKSIEKGLWLRGCISVRHYGSPLKRPHNRKSPQSVGPAWDKQSPRPVYRVMVRLFKKYYDSRHAI